MMELNSIYLKSLMSHWWIWEKD